MGIQAQTQEQLEAKSEELARTRDQLSESFQAQDQLRLRNQELQQQVSQQLRSYMLMLSMLQQKEKDIAAGLAVAAVWAERVEWAELVHVSRDIAVAGVYDAGYAASAPDGLWLGQLVFEYVVGPRGVVRTTAAVELPEPESP